MTCSKCIALGMIHTSLHSADRNTTDARNGVFRLISHHGKATEAFVTRSVPIEIDCQKYISKHSVLN